jgi:hypothetical protein
MARSSNNGDADDSASPLARAAARIGRPHKVLDFPGMANTRVAIWCPNEDEESRADIAARQRLTQTFKLTALDLSLAQETELVKREREIELLALVLRDPHDPTQAFTESSEELREHIAGPQRAMLVEAIEDFKRERFMARTPEEDEALVKVLTDMGKVGGVLPTWLLSCDAATLRRIVEVLVGQSSAVTPARTPSTPLSSSKT